MRTVSQLGCRRPRSSGATPSGGGEEEPRPSAQKVEALRRKLPCADCRLIDLYLQENGRMPALARRLHIGTAGVKGRYARLFRRMAAAATAD